MTSTGTFRQVWLWPTLIAIASTAGLVSALIGDGPWDFASWVTLGVPLVIVAVAWRRSRRSA